MEQNQVDVAPQNQSADNSTSSSSKPDIILDNPPESETKDESDAETTKGKVSRFATIMNLLNGLVGAGILAVPASYIKMGIFPASLILLGVGLISYSAASIVIRLQLETDAQGFDDLTLKVAGKVGSIVLSVLALCLLVSGMIGYVIIAGDFIISWFSLVNIDLNPLWRRAIMILIYSICIPVALTFPRSLKFLSYFSTATVFFAFLFFFAVITRFITNYPKNGIAKSIHYAKFDINLFYGIAIFALAFALPTVCLTIFLDYTKDLKKRRSATFISVMITYFLILIPSVLGYLMFGDQTDGNILKNFPDNDILMIMVRIGFFCVVTFSYPCIARPAMGSIAQIIYKKNDSSSLPFGQRCVIMVVTHTFPVLIAMFLPESRPILGVGGAIGGCVGNFLYPAILLYLVDKPKVLSFEFLGIVLLGIFGVVSGVISAVLSIIDCINAFKKQI